MASGERSSDSGMRVQVRPQPQGPSRQAWLLSYVMRSCDIGINGWDKTGGQQTKTRDTFP